MSTATRASRWPGWVVILPYNPNLLIYTYAPLGENKALCNPQDNSQPFLHLAKRMTERNKNRPGARMTTSYCISTNKRQHKLRNSKKIARDLRAISPKYRAHLKRCYSPHHKIQPDRQ